MHERRRRILIGDRQGEWASIMRALADRKHRGGVPDRLLILYS
jgi:hypothetical protein